MTCLVVACASSPPAPPSPSPTAFQPVSVFGDPGKINGFFIAGYVAAGVGGLCLLCAVFLCGEGAATMTGSIIPVDGGWTAQ